MSLRHQQRRIARRQLKHIADLSFGQVNAVDPLGELARQPDPHTIRGSNKSAVTNNVADGT